MCLCCKKEFQLRRFGFSDCNPSKFQKFLWCEEKIPFVIYRTSTLIFQIGWLISIIVKQENFLRISNWGVCIPVIYYAFSWLSSIEGLRKKSPPATIHGYENKTMEQEMTQEQVENDVPEISNKDQLRWFHKVTWMFHTISLNIVLLVTILYWILIFPREDPETRNISGIFKHAINFALLFLDMFLIGIPVRILHVVYGILTCAIYAVFLVIVHLTGLEHAVYGFINFKTNPGLGAGILILITVFGTMIFHAFWYGLYHLRSLIHQSCLKRNAKGE